MKLIEVYLTIDDIPEDKFHSVAFTLKSFESKVKFEQEYIYTTQTHAISSYYYNLGYDIKVISEGNEILFSDLLNGNTENSYHKEIRSTQNWEKMLHAGCFNIPFEWDKENL